MNLLDQVKSIPQGAFHIAQWLGANGTVVPQEEAQARADICVTCPKNIGELAIATPVASAVKKIIALKNQIKLRVDGESKLHTCEVCGCALRLLVWQPSNLVQSQLTEEERQQTPAHCWKIKTST